MTTQTIELQPISPADEQSMATIIRAVLAEYGANRPGFAWQDPELDYLCRAYAPAGHCYLILKDAEGSCLSQAEGSVLKHAEGSMLRQAERSVLREAEGSAAKNGGRVLGGAGIAPFALATHEVEFYPTCELQKMYLVSEARGQGLGKRLLLTLIDQARALGYRYMYLESFSKMHEALALYESLGFVALSAPLGASEHNACDKWSLLEL